jgi:hypothetical protein
LERKIFRVPFFPPTPNFAHLPFCSFYRGNRDPFATNRRATNFENPDLLLKNKSLQDTKKRQKVTCFSVINRAPREVREVFLTFSPSPSSPPARPAAEREPKKQQRHELHNDIFLGTRHGTGKH